MCSGVKNCIKLSSKFVESVTYTLPCFIRAVVVDFLYSLFQFGVQAAYIYSCFDKGCPAEAQEQSFCFKT